MHQCRHGTRLYWAPPLTDLDKCQQSATHANERQLRLWRQASQGKYVGLALTESSTITSCLTSLPQEHTPPQLRLHNDMAMHERAHRTRRRLTTEAPTATQTLLDASSLPNCPRRPQARRLSNHTGNPPSTSPQSVVDFETMPPRRKKTHQQLNKIDSKTKQN
jgi:hypothetical protein